MANKWKRFLAWLFPLECCACGKKTRILEDHSKWKTRPIWMNNGWFSGWTTVSRCQNCHYWPEYVKNSKRP